MEKDIDLSRRLGRAVAARVAKGCWRNAYCALAEVPDARYVEGWAVNRSSGQLIEHGWLEVADSIVDPTLPEDPLVYFPGLRVTAEEAHTLVNTKSTTMKRRELPIVWRYGWGGKDHAEYKAAHNAAWSFIRQLLAQPGISPSSR